MSTPTLPRAASRALPSARLLVVDDDISAIQQFGRLLVGFTQISFATGGAEALEIAQAQQPDLVLLDAEMPAMSGLEVCRALKADPLTARTPVIFVTSHREPELEAAALRLGAADYLTKPIESSQLLARVCAQLRRRGEPEPTLDAARSAPRLLIIDDDSSSIQLLRHLLTELGDFHFALDGAQGLELASVLTPDLVLLDADMPGCDGYEVCTRLKRDPALRHVPVVFVTQFGDADHEARAFDVGADDFIVKPYAPPALLARVRRLVAQRRQVEATLDGARRQWQRIGEARLAEVVAEVIDAFVCVDEKSTIVLANNAACRLFGVPQAGATGQALAAFLPEWVTGGGAGGRHLLCRADGKTVSVEVSTSSAGEGPERLRTLILRARAEEAPAAPPTIPADEMKELLESISRFVEQADAGPADRARAAAAVGRLRALAGQGRAEPAGPAGSTD